MQQDIKPILRNIAVVYWIMFLSLVTYIVISALIVSNTDIVFIADMQGSYIVNAILIFTLILLAPVSYLVPQKMINAIREDLSLTDKLLQYRTPMFIRFITMNSAGLLIAAGFLLTTTTHLIYLQVVVMLFFIIYKPSRFKIASDLQLNDREREQLMAE